MLPSVSLTLALTPLHTNMRTHTHSASLPVRMMPLVLRSAPPVSDGAQDWPKWASLLEEHLLHLSLKILPFNQTWAWMLFHTHRIGSVPELTAILVSRTTKTFPVSRRWWKTTLRLLFLRTNLTILQLACINELAQCDTDNFVVSWSSSRTIISASRLLWGCSHDHTARRMQR